jgi:hypothetical protein
MSKFPCHMLGLCVKMSHLRHKSHTQFLPPGAAIYVILRLSRAPRNKLNQATWGEGCEGGRKSRRASGILNVAISKVLKRSFISPHMPYNMFRGGCTHHNYRNETANYCVRVGEKVLHPTGMLHS